jgi:anti-sigma B factor antagonist
MTRSKGARQAAAAVRLSIAGELTIYRALELKRVLIEALEKKVALEVDLSQVTDLDSAGVQLLLLSQRTAEANEVELRFVEHSPVVMEVLALMGLSASLGARAEPISSEQASGAV